MVKFLWRILERILAPLPGWMFLCSGMSLLGMAIIVPAWVDAREQAWRLDLMRAQAKCITQEHQRFTQFNAALASDDPIVLERLAYYYLRLQPQGETALDANLPARSGAYPRLFDYGLPADNRAGIMPALAMRPMVRPTPSVEQMLRQPLPKPGVNFPVYQPVNTRLVRITTSWRRYPLIAAGILAMLAGIYMHTPGTSPQEDGEETEDEAPFDPMVPVVGQEDAVDGDSQGPTVAHGEPGLTRA